MLTTDEPDSGIPILPHQNYFFNEPFYVRCIDGNAKARVITEGVNSCDANDFKFSCGSKLCGSCCETTAGGVQAGIQGILIDGVEQYINSDNYAELDLSDYINEKETIDWSDISNLFNF